MTADTRATDRAQQLAALGAQLRSARENQAYSVAEVAERLFLSSSQVNAIEQGNYDYLPAEVFVKGYLRSYAKLLQLDPALILAQYQPPVAELPEHTEVETEPAPRKGLLERLPDLPGVLVWSAMAALAALLIATVIYFSASSATEDEAAPALPQPAGEQSGHDDPATASPFAALGSAAEVGDHLEIHFSEDCWVEVRDASRKILLADMRRAGDTEIVRGEPPYKVVLGRYSAVAVRYQGRAIPVVPDEGSRSAQLVIGG
jgi:cytoskeleton protein RodZ